MHNVPIVSPSSSNRILIGMEMNENAPIGHVTGHVAVVTGAARGIGRAIAERLGKMGATVVLTARDRGKLEVVRQSIESGGGKAVVVPCDLLQETSINDLAAVVRQQGRCDIVVNCAGVGHIGQPLHEMDVRSFDEVVDTNLRAPYLTIRALAPMMIEAQTGHIINISSLAGKNPLKDGAAYAASKWGLNGLTYSVAEELRPYNIRVSVVAPGSVNTGFGGGDGDSEKAQRKIQPADIAEIVGTGQVWNPQGLRSICLKADDGFMDVNTLAFKIVQQSIGEEPKKKIQPATAKRGHARANALSPERRKAIAQKAAAARWKPEQ